MSDRRLYLLTADQVESLARAGAVGTHAGEALAALRQDPIHCDTCRHWRAYSSDEGFCDWLVEVTPSSVVCAAWEALTA
jgi:hypothetical protein